MINNLGYTFKDVVDEQNKSAACLNNTFKSIADWAIKTEDRLASLESRGGGAASTPFTPWAKSISEVKAIQNLEQLGTDKGEVRNWMDRLVNALV